jgi:plastocyanin
MRTPQPEARMGRTDQLFPIPTLLLGLLALAGSAPVAGQSGLESPPWSAQVWTGVPWSLDLAVGPLLGRVEDDGISGRSADPSLRVALTLPARLLAEVRYAPQPLELDGQDEVEGAIRAAFLGQDHGRWVDLGLEARFGTASAAAAASITAARWIGQLRLLATARALSPGHGEIRPTGGLAAVWHPAAGRAGVALAASLDAFLDRQPDESPAWNAALQLGIPHTPHTLSLMATNAGTSLLGRTAGVDRTRLGIQVTGHVPLGRILGLYVDRETARDAVRADRHATPAAVVHIRDYRYAPARIEIDAGGVVEWVNHDRVVHTATADDGAWNSGAIPTGERWRAAFNEPGIYPYYCGPHPYMRGVVVVR